MPELFERTSIKSIEIANRSVRSATWSGVGDERGYVTDLAVDLYSRLAAGGVGLIITGYQYVLPNGMQLPFMIGNYEDDQIEGLTRLAEAIHAQGCKVVPQLVQTGIRANPKLVHEGWEVWAATADPASGKAKEMTTQDILKLIEAYAAAALRSKKAGFDGIQLHGAHGYGINQFLSPAFNQRGDAYGGSSEKRYRFLGETLEAVRGAVGDDFPVLIKLNAHDFLDGGLLPDETLEVARRLSDDGIDAIEVSGGSAGSGKLGPARMKIRKPEDEAYFLDLASGIKDATGLPVITVGGIRSVETINDILSEGKADYVAMSRPFVREPDLVNRWKSGDTAKAKCISCNGCFETGMKGTGVTCKVERKLKENKE